MDECVEIESSDEEHIEQGSREYERIGISSASSSPQPQQIQERTNTPVSANLRNSNLAANRTRRYESGQLKKLETDPKFLANFNPETSRREKRKLNRKSTPLVVPKTTGIYNEKGIHRDSGRDMCDCLDLGCSGCHFPCQCCGSAKCGPHCRVTRKWMYETIEHDAKDLVIKNKLLSRK
ncbi:ARL14 effector protein [Toxorhynchites rutilus septentrionalis]|uniref:ARL14 effector protein n=1 Tax=Toxorhynchites rutilus septentrionalis TaxID=329112 RepID=UPI002478A0BA|nr:ARL14 effector protein [Toxorhynchites rutilus septentrionalis]